MRKRVVLVAGLFILMAPIAVLADTINFAASGGTFVNTGTTLDTTLSGGASSTLNSAAREPAGNSFSGNLGTVDVTTGSLLSGSVAFGGMFGAGGAITIVANGTWDGGALAGETIFSGAFLGPLAWFKNPNDTNFILNGPVAGTYSADFAALMFPGCTTCGTAPSGSLFTLTVSGTFPFGASGNIANQYVVHLETPEPATLALFGAGLVGIAGLIRRRRSA